MTAQKLVQIGPLFLQYFKQEISIFYNTRDALWVINAIWA